MNLFSLANKTILITGASSGFGRAIAIACAEAGANVVLTARNEDRLHETLSMMAPGEHRVITFDVTRTDLLEDFIAQLPKLDGVVFCAGILQTIPVKFITEDSLLQMMQTNSFAPIMMAQRLTRKNLINRDGSVVFISSIAVNSAAIGNAVYAASKGAVNSFARCMALELSRQHIRVNCVQPGLIRTGISDTRVISQEDLEKEESHYPLGPGRPEDVAAAVQYLLSPASRWVTGTNLIIDGGLSML